MDKQKCDKYKQAISICKNKAVLFSRNKGKKEPAARVSGNSVAQVQPSENSLLSLRWWRREIDENY